MDIISALKNTFTGGTRNIAPVALISLDGWGMAPPSKGNAIYQARTPNMDSYFENYPHGALIASGESVGLPATEVGNSEVGHLTMGVGRVIYQSLKRINVSIEKGDFFENKAFEGAAKHVLVNKSKIHLLGLIGSGNVHSNTEHLYALLQFCKKALLKNVYLHLFTDGRDAPPTDGVEVVAKIEEKLKFFGVGQIATVSGRYYAMDRDGRWERIQRAYNALVLGAGPKATDAVSAIKASYQAGKTDEFVEPTVISTDGTVHTIDDNDACIFFNFRVDRARELSMALALPDFETVNVADYGFSPDANKPTTTFTRGKIAKNLFFVTMTEYQKKLPVSAVAFPPQYNFPDSLPEIFSKNNLASFHLAESEKERMVTYYFRGMSNQPFPSEEVVVVPSPKVPTYDKKPEMAAYDIARELKRAVQKDKYHFIVMNFANPDMVAHSGNIPATIKAIEHVDKAVGEVVKTIASRNGVIVITADHGNAEEMLSFSSNSFFYTSEEGVKNTDHSSNPVPLLIIGERFKNKPVGVLKGTLADIAPTILGIMNLPVPETMSGRDLLEGV